MEDSGAFDPGFYPFGLKRTFGGPFYAIAKGAPIVETLTRIAARCLHSCSLVLIECGIFFARLFAD